MTMMMQVMSWQADMWNLLFQFESLGFLLDRLSQKCKCPVFNVELVFIHTLEGLIISFRNVLTEHLGDDSSNIDAPHNPTFELAWSKGWKLQPYVLVGIDSVPLFDIIEDPMWNWCGYMIWNICDAMLFMDSTMVGIYNTVLHNFQILSEVHEWCLDMSLPTTVIREKIKMQLNIWYSYQSMRNGVGTHMSVDCLVKAHGSVPEGRV